MFLSELTRIKNGDHTKINPHAKTESRKVRRAKARQARLEARNLGAAANQNIHTREIEKVI
ncbi:MAG: hypothetical protein QNJ53_20980 [Pleurocapsa sp. MO_192.B19]|nr:hypothetical protein [Pleurocapsa sp. MO_192.B19]